MKIFRDFFLFAGIMFLSAGCGRGQQPPEESPPDGGNGGQKGKQTMKVTSTVFENGKPLPSDCAYRNKNISPALNWQGAPAGVKNFALISDDPDAPRAEPWVHWVVYNIPPEITSLPEGVAKLKKLENGALQGKNDFGKIGWDGPAPPSGVHRYYFRVYALDAVIDMDEGATKAKLLKSMKGHILAEGVIMGTYAAD